MAPMDRGGGHAPRDHRHGGQPGHGHGLLRQPAGPARGAAGVPRPVRPRRDHPAPLPQGGPVPGRRAGRRHAGEAPADAGRRPLHGRLHALRPHPRGRGGAVVLHAAGAAGRRRVFHARLRRQDGAQGGPPRMAGQVEANGDGDGGDATDTLRPARRGAAWARSACA